MTSDDRSKTGSPESDERADHAPAAEKLSTREAILDSAIEILRRDGMAALTTRAIAREAGVNQALINYHYQTKRNLLLETSRALETKKYARQSSMYHEPGVPLSTKWRQAVEFYRRDLDDGYIRLKRELEYLAMSDPEMAKTVNERNRRWTELLEEVASAYLPPLGIDVEPAIVAETITNFWFGMDDRILTGQPDIRERTFALLDQIGDWLEERERQRDIHPGN